jgi:hypothetical protein
VAAQLGERLFAVKRNLDREPLSRQHLGEELGKIVLVVDHKSAAPSDLGKRSCRRAAR